MDYTTNLKIVITEKKGNYDLNGACVEPKQGNGLTPMKNKEKIERNICDRFDLCCEECDY